MPSISPSSIQPTSTALSWQLDLSAPAPAQDSKPAIAADSLALGGGVKATIAPVSAKMTPAMFPHLFGVGQLWSQRLMGWFSSLTPPPAPAPAPAPTPAPAGPLPTGSLTQAIAATPAGKPLSLGAGVFSFNGFGSDLAHVKGNRTDWNGLDLPARMPGLAGAGIDRTVIRMNPHTSTNAKDIPTAPMTTNQYTMMRVTGDNVNLHDFTLQGTDQGHLYNGLRMHICNNPRVTNVKVTGTPGSGSSPPGETFGLCDYRTANAVYDHIEVDGQGVGASGFGANNSTNVTIKNSLFHNNPHGIGATFWQTKDVTLIDCTTKDNHNGFNFERVSGTVNIIRPVFGKIAGTHDISIGTDQSNAVYNIYDPVLQPGQKLRILVGKNYLGKPSPQQRSNVHVYVNGVDKTNELVHWE